MDFFQIKGHLEAILKYLKAIDRNTLCSACVGTNLSTAGTGDIPAGLNSFTITKTSSDSDTVTITLPDGSIYILNNPGETFSESSAKELPAYNIAGPGTWKWYGK